MDIPFKVWRQHFVPQHLLTWFAGKLARCQIRWFKEWAIRRFIRLYEVDLNEAQEPNPSSYPSFHDFFIRELKPGIRPIDRTLHTVCSPCDGTISQIGAIHEGALLQAKNRTFSVQALLGNSEQAKIFSNGHFATIYLAPKDYHRVHMPCSGKLQQTRYIPGKLFSVNPLTTTHVDQLFARNERVVTLFKNESGSFAVIFVGAMLVGNIFTRWSGYQTPHRNKNIVTVDYPDTPDRFITLDKGEEMGYFSLGSTVILLFTEELRWEQKLSQHSRIVVGQQIGHFLP